MAWSNFTQIGQENASALHFLLTPVRMARSLIQTAVLIVVGLVFLSIWIPSLAYNSWSWEVGLGPMGSHTQEDRLGHTMSQSGLTAPPIITADLRYRGSIPDLSNNYYGNPVNEYLEEPLNPQFGVAMPVYQAYSGTTLFPYCGGDVPFHDPGQALTGWRKRAVVLFDRKASVNYEAYVTAAASVVMLRNTLIWLKMYGRIPRGVWRQVIGSDEFCQPDPVDYPEFNQENWDEWTRISKSITFPDAPVLTMKVVESHDGVGTGHSRNRFYEISGICLNDDCQDSDLNFYYAGKKDLFAQTPILSPRQQAVASQLNALSYDAFWIKEAHRNGVYHYDSEIRMVAEDARYRISTMITPYKDPEVDGGYYLLDMFPTFNKPDQY